MKTCGDFGGVGRSGSPCGRRVKEGMCASHNKAGAAEAAARKVAFFEEYSTGLVSLKAAAEKAGAAAVTVWRWRQEDPAFNEALSALQANIDDIRLTMVEDSLVARCLKPDAPPALVIFYLVNRSGGRWRHIQRHEHTGPEGGPIETQHVHVYVPDNGRNRVSSNSGSNSNRASSRAPGSVSRNGR